MASMRRDPLEVDTHRPENRCIDHFRELVKRAYPLILDEWDGTSETSDGNRWLRDAEELLGIDDSDREAWAYGGDPKGWRR